MASAVPDLMSIVYDDARRVVQDTSAATRSSGSRRVIESADRVGYRTKVLPIEYR
jgi:hypothetical protein